MTVPLNGRVRQFKKGKVTHIPASARTRNKQATRFCIVGATLAINNEKCNKNNQGFEIFKPAK